jgi:hypothetical protein
VIEEPKKYLKIKGNNQGHQANNCRRDDERIPSGPVGNIWNGPERL